MEQQKPEYRTPRIVSAENVASKNTLQRDADDRTQLPLWTAVTSYLVAYLYVAAFLFGFALDVHPVQGYQRGPQNWQVLLFTVVFFGWAAVCIGKIRKYDNCKAKMLVAVFGENREASFWLGCGLVISVAIALGRCNATGGYAGLVLHGIAAYWVLCATGTLTEDATGPFFVWDVFHAFVVAPFGGFALRIKTMVYAAVDGIRNVRGRMGEKKLNVKNLLFSLCFVGLALPFLCLAGSLLSQADRAGFAGFWQGLTNLVQLRRQPLPEWVWSAVMRFAVSLPVGAYLYGLVAGSARREKPVLDSAAVRRGAEQLRAAPKSALVVVFGLFCALYAVFFVFQAGHLFGAFFGVVPGSATASEYAREGFFQLCQVMVINFGLLTVSAKCSRVPLRSNKLLRAFALILMAESLLLAVTAGSKLWLYIARFGFTPLRLLSSWAVVVLAAGCVLAVATILRPCRAVQKWIWFAAGSFALLCLY